MFHSVTPLYSSLRQRAAHHLYAFIFSRVNNSLKETTLNLSGNTPIISSCSGLCLSEQAKSKHRSTASWKQSLWFNTLRLHHHGLVVDSAISLLPAEAGLFVDLDRPLILEHLYILAKHCGGFTARIHLIFITSLSLYELTSSQL